MISIDSVTEKKYWKLQKMIPKDKRSLPIKGNFKTNLLYSWLCYTGFVDMALFRKFKVLRPSEWFEIEVFDLQSLGKFDVWAGIVRKSGKEIVVSNTQAISPKEFIAVIQLIRRSELEKIMHTYKDLMLFIAVDEKDEKREEKVKFYMKMQKFRTDYKELLLSGKNSDFTINVKPTKFEVHRSILGARSPVFSAMMEHDTKEKCTGEVSIIDADPAVFKEFLLYLYTGDEEHLDWKNVAELYELADKYCVEDLKYLCVVRMCAHISIENFFHVFYISQQLNNLKLSEGVIQFFLEDSKEIVASKEYTEFMKEHPEEASVLEKASAKNINNIKQNINATYFIDIITQI